MITDEHILDSWYTLGEFMETVVSPNHLSEFYLYAKNLITLRPAHPFNWEEIYREFLNREVRV